MDNLQKAKILIELQDVYRKIFTNGESISDYDEVMLDRNIFPKWWTSNQNADFKIELITKAIEEKTKITNLDETMKIDQMYGELQFGMNVEESKKNTAKKC